MPSCGATSPGWTSCPASLLSKTQLVCGACREAFKLDAQRARQLGIAAELPRFVDHLEGLQLAGKSEVQRGFLKAQREQPERVDQPFSRATRRSAPA